MSESISNTENIPLTVKVSVIIPVFNADKYIRKCLDSLLNQTLKEIEIICIDDGSTDASYKILEEYASKNARILYQSQQNLFAGIARNAGLSRAIGKYVIFLDADDFFAPTMLKELYEEAEKHTAQIVVFGHYKYNDKNGEIAKVPFSVKKTQLVSCKDLGINLFEACGATPWNKLLLREYIESKHLAYQGIMNNNDEFFNRMIVVDAERILFYNKRFVYYRTNNSNSLQGGLGRNVLCFGEALKAIYDELDSRNKLRGDIRITYFKYAIRMINSNISQVSDYSNLKKIYDFLKNDVIPHIFSNEQIPEKTVPILIDRSPTCEDFLFEYKKLQESHMVSKDTLDYKLGHWLLSGPKHWILSILKRITA